MQPDSAAGLAEQKTWLGGVFLSHLTRSEIVEQAHKWITGKSKGNYVCAINVSKLASSQKDAKLKSFLEKSSLNIADGAPILAATRWVGKPIPERITGVDLMEELLRLSDRHGFRVYFFGSRQTVLDKVISHCEKEHPDLTIAGARNGYFSPDEEPEVVADIAGSDADILLVALGVPQKEYFLDDHNDRLNVSLALPVGGAFDVLAGEKKRAPESVQRLGVEWLWRSAYDLSRARLVIKSAIPFLGIVIREVAQQRFGLGKNR